MPAPRDVFGKRDQIAVKLVGLDHRAWDHRFAQRFEGFKPALPAKHMMPLAVSVAAAISDCDWPLQADCRDVLDQLRKEILVARSRVSVLVDIEFAVPNQWPATPLFTDPASGEAASSPFT
jgi:hypothetical protein